MVDAKKNMYELYVTTKQGHRTSDWDFYYDEANVTEQQASGRAVVTDEAQVTAAVTAQAAHTRYLLACSSRGKQPPKFNGEFFSSPSDPSQADERQWGAGVWFQNTRLAYYPCMANGDADLMTPFFDFYLRSLPYQMLRTREYFGHDGAYWPEAGAIWGANFLTDNCNRNYTPPNKPIFLPGSGYNAYNYQQSLDLGLLVMDHYAYFDDSVYLKKYFPLVAAGLDWYTLHYNSSSRSSNATNDKIEIYPDQAVETWWCAAAYYPPKRQDCVTNGIVRALLCGRLLAEAVHAAGTVFSGTKLVVAALWVMQGVKRARDIGEQARLIEADARAPYRENPPQLYGIGEDE
jgi:hypothetical protein